MNLIGISSERVVSHASHRWLFMRFPRCIPCSVSAFHRASLLCRLPHPRIECTLSIRAIKHLYGGFQRTRFTDTRAYAHVGVRARRTTLPDAHAFCDSRELILNPSFQLFHDPRRTVWIVCTDDAQWLLDWPSILTRVRMDFRIAHLFRRVCVVQHGERGASVHRLPKGVQFAIA